MSSREPGNNRYLKLRNQGIILNLIRKEERLSRIELARNTRLSATAIGMITANLMEEGYIYEVGMAQSTGGRKPKLLELKEGAYFSLGFDVEADSLRLILMDIRGKVYDHVVETFTSPPPVEEARKIMRHMSESVITKHSILPERLLGTGISVPGPIDRNAGLIVRAPNLNWKNVPFSAFQGLWGEAPLFFENEANASAICEHWQGAAREKDNFICINASSGIGAGIFINGKIYHGAAGFAGEIGHNVVEEDGPPCNCGNYGCLETLVSPGRLVSKARRMVLQGTSSGLAAYLPKEITLEKIVELAGENDHEALMILKESARYLGIGIAAIINTLNPELVILGKKFTLYSALVLESLKQVVYTKIFDDHAKKLKILSSSFRDTSSALGAAILPQVRIFI